MRKHFFFFTCLFLLVAFAAVNNPLGLPKTLKFNSKSYSLKSSNSPTPVFFEQHYFLAKESVDSFTSKLSVFYLHDNVKMAEVIQKKVKELDERKKIDPACAYTLLKNEKGSEYMLDYTLSETRDSSIQRIEYTIYRYQGRTVNGRKGILVTGTSVRKQQAELQAFKTNFSKIRSELLNAISDFELPAITIKSNSK